MFATMIAKSSSPLVFTVNLRTLYSENTCLAPFTNWLDVHKYNIEPGSTWHFEWRRSNI